MDPRSVRSFASVRGSPSVEVAFSFPTEINKSLAPSAAGLNSRALSLSLRVELV